MSLKFKPQNLVSRLVRNNLAEGKSGSSLLNFIATKALPRKISKLTSLDTGSEQQGGFSIIKFFWNGLSSFGGWLFSQGLKLLSFSASAIWGWVSTSLMKLWNFNWNATDEELKKTIEGQSIALATVWGSFVGQGLGWLAGIGVGYGISFLVPVIGGAGLAKLVASKTSIEALEELTGGLKGALSTTAGALANSALISGYINYRQMLKKAPQGLLEAIYGKDTANFIRNVWGSKGTPNMSFAQQTENAVNAIDSKIVKAFVEAALEESWDSFMEAGFIVAAEIDNAYSQHNLSNKSQLGAERTVEVQPNKESKEKLIFTEIPQNQLIPMVQQTLNTHRMMHDRDIGTMVGMPIDDYMKGSPQSLRLVIQMFSVKEPPFRSRSSSARVTRTTITVPDVSRASLDWGKIKLAVGGANGYLWGRYRATAYLDNGRLMSLYAASENEAEQRIDALLLLTTAKLRSLTVMEEKKKGERLTRPTLQKEPTRVYPAYFTVINREEFLDTTKGNPSLKANFNDKRGRIELWTENKPSDCEEIITRILTKGL